MKTKEQLQAAVNELLDVCKKHGIAIVGTCESEGIYGEITIGEATQESIGWLDVKLRVDNEVIGDDQRGYSVGGIGDIDG